MVTSVPMPKESGEKNYINRTIKLIIKYVQINKIYARYRHLLVLNEIANDVNGTAG